MKKNTQTLEVFLEKIKTHADMVWLKDGNGWIYRGLGDDNWPRTPDDKPVKYLAYLYGNNDLIHITPCLPTGRKRYTLLNLRQYSKLRRTQRELQLMIHVPLSMPWWVAERVMRDEFEKQMQFLKTHVWNKNRKEVA